MGGDRFPHSVAVVEVAEVEGDRFGVAGYVNASSQANNPGAVDERAIGRVLEG